MNKQTISNLLLYGIPALLILSGIGYMVYYSSVYCSLSKENLDKIKLLHPKLRKKAHRLICDLIKNGIDVRITDTLRSVEDQIKAYNEGTSQVRLGYHNFGLALDIVDKIKGYNKTDWNTIGKLATKHGFEWGGYWKDFVDKPHLQYTFGYKIKELEELYNKGKLKDGYVQI
jgi:pyruvate dehydrogenase complex dehydrogenase (E1) component